VDTSSELSFADKARFCGYLLQIAGLIAVPFCFWRLFDRIDIAMSHDRAQGTVVGHVPRERLVSSGRVRYRKTYYYPVVAYQAKGREFFLEAEVPDETGTEYQKGQAVNVLYPAGEPAKGQIENFTEMYFVALVRGALAVALFLAAWVAFKLPGLKDDPRPEPAAVPENAAYTRASSSL
jgi:hypothetical protein